MDIDAFGLVAVQSLQVRRIVAPGRFVLNGSTAGGDGMRSSRGFARAVVSVESVLTYSRRHIDLQRVTSSLCRCAGD
jgi:hypothetical protein